MDSAAKTLRHQHRKVGHDIPALIQMMAIFGNKYKPMQIFRTWLLHKAVDGMDSGFKAGVRKAHKGYGKKASTYEIINKLKKELFR